MRNALVSAALLLCALVLACDKDEPRATTASPEAGPAPSPTTAPAPAPAVEAGAATASPSGTAPAASAAPAAPRCPAGLTGNAVPAYCIKLPAGYSVKDARTTPAKGSIAYETGSPTDALMVSYDSTSIAEQTKDVESELKFGGDKIEKKGDLPGGGKWYLGSHADYERVVTLVKGPAPLTLKCSFAYKPKSAPSKDAIDVCKSIVVP